MTKHPPTGFVVLWTGRFYADKIPEAGDHKDLAVLIPRSEVATLQKAEEAFLKRIKWFKELQGSFGPDAELEICLDHVDIITNCIAYGDCLAHIETTDWEMMCAMEAFDHIYVSRCQQAMNVYHIRVSKGPWKVDKT
ncbi:hypothetical protein BDD12DRAFT_912346 [Trichophaea hybrida]|nr:hypothetical protein BDD12DRAFT_912346 [Trichophaea hybrida]